MRWQGKRRKKIFKNNLQGGDDINKGNDIKKQEQVQRKKRQQEEMKGT